MLFRSGMAMANPDGGGTDVAMGTAGITLMRGDVALVAQAIDISSRTVAKIRQNLFWAFAYNVAGIPLAALGYLSPVVAGAAMALSSVSVMTNALLLRRASFAPRIRPSPPAPLPLGEGGSPSPQVPSLRSGTSPLSQRERGRG